jgi:hypothetical protein
MPARRAWTSLGIVLALLGCSKRDHHAASGSMSSAGAAGASSESTCADVVEKLSACGLAKGRQLKDCADGDRLHACLAGCVEQANCQEIEGGFCRDDTNDFSNCLKACHDAPPPEFVCSDGSSIPADWRCDGGPDCPAGEDENCPSGSFVCQDGLRLPAGWRCDTVADCAQGEDELDCPGSPTLTCPDGTEFAARRLCDGTPDCAGGEDELDCVVLTCE